PSSPLLTVASVYSPLNPPTATLFLPPLSGNGSGGGGDALEKAVARGRGRQIRRLCRWGWIRRCSRSSLDDGDEDPVDLFL
ncbi:hypothetical protein EE612_058877, partial [Oryza sativa]